MDFPYVDFYCKNYNKELKRVVDKILLKKFPWLPQKYYDDFISTAARTVWYCEKRYDETRNNSFEKYLINSLQRKFKSELTHINRKKRKGENEDISLDAYIEKEEKLTIFDVVATKEVADIAPLTQRYLDSLTKKQRQIAELMMQGCNDRDIKAMLRMSNEQYEVAILNMKKDKKIAPLKTLKERMGQNDDNK